MSCPERVGECLEAMDLSQMCVQAMWETNSPLKQIPHFDAKVHFRCLYQALTRT